jgi:hypothetical protein
MVMIISAGMGVSVNTGYPMLQDANLKQALYI